MERLVLRRLVLLGTPLALAVLEIFHPERPTSAGEAVEQGPWFMWFHFIQVPSSGSSLWLSTCSLKVCKGGR